MSNTVDIQPGKIRKAFSWTLETSAHDAFANTRDSRFYYGSPCHEQALSTIHALVEDGNREFGLLSGGAGLGKTLLRTVLHRALDPTRFIRVTIETSLLDFDQILLEIISQIGGDRVHAAELPDRYSRLSEFKTRLIRYAVHSSRHLVIMIDEADGLAKETLDGLRNLSNISSEKCNLMTFILIGNNQLESNLQKSPDLNQRISERTRLLPLSQKETKRYVLHRLGAAGSQESPRFSEQAWAHMYHVSRGIPREINHVFNRALSRQPETANGFDGPSVEKAITSQSAHQVSNENIFT